MLGFPTILCFLDLELEAPEWVHPASLLGFMCPSLPGKTDPGTEEIQRGLSSGWEA